ncbi:MAG TPA: hypothetical protein VLE48_09435 [Terriglobales bacterium]|nr:hypothetical protein [Terriglobales bacterium]
MGFQDFYGNAEAVRTLREMLARGRFPHSIILHGPAGAGKYTLAQMLAKAMNCERAPQTGGLPDFCGECSACRRIAQADDFDTCFAEAVEAREGLREADKRDARLFLQTFPDVTIVPPDPPQMMIKVGQVRRVTETVYFRPAAGRERVYVFTTSAFMREAANALLKVLEEPPEFATLILLAENPGELLPTLRSRCFSVRLSPLPVAEMEAWLDGAQPKWTAKQRALVARLSEGAVGRARSFDLAAYVEARNDALSLLASALESHDHSALFKVTDSYRGGADGREKTARLLRTLYSVLEDMLFLKSGTPELVRNTDIAARLERLAAPVDFAWLAAAAQELDQVEAGMRRNLLRSLSLDAFATALERD